MRYFAKGSLTCGDIVGYIDVDWAGLLLDTRLTTRCCVFTGGNLVSWKSKKQIMVVRSSAEVEYGAMTSTTRELIWFE